MIYRFTSHAVVASNSALPSRDIGRHVDFKTWVYGGHHERSGEDFTWKQGISRRNSVESL